MKRSTTFLALLGAASLSSCGYKPMNSIPRPYVIDPEWQSDERGISTINFEATIPNSSFTGAFDEVERLSYRDVQTENIEPVPVTGKTKNPLYNPNKWIKTKNPTYNPKKWLKACAFGRCIKTKNPLYDPKKWIKTKNPAYSPNKWIEVEAFLPTIQGYEVNADVDGKVRYEPYGTNKFDVTVPISTDGWVSLVTPITPPLIRKPFRGKLDLTGNFAFDVTPDWCLASKVGLRPRWRERLKIDFSGGLYLLTIDMSKYAEDMIDDARDDIQEGLDTAIDCNGLRQSAEEAWQTRVMKIREDSFAYFQPTSAKLSNLNFGESEISIRGRLSGNIGVITDETEAPVSGPLPDLVVGDPGSTSISLNIPVEVAYSSINRELVDSLAQNPPLIGTDSSPIRGKVLVKEVDAYPSGESIVLKVKFETQTNTSLTDVKATAYFKGRLSYQRYIDGRITALSMGELLKNSQDLRHVLSYDLESVSFNEFGNGKDKALLTLAYSALKDSVETPIEMDITEPMERASDYLREAITQLSLNLNEGRAISGDDEPIREVDAELLIDDWAYLSGAIRFVLRGTAEFADDDNGDVEMTREE